MNEIIMKNGIFYMNGKRTFLLSADYPYYRDDPANWGDRLEKLKAAHIGIVSFYVPWRHHAVNGRIDFTGETRPNRNVKAFIRLCAEKGLLALLKPGPFIHAETDYGGLPDFVSPEQAEAIDPMLNGRGERRKWHKELPAPTDPAFEGMVRDWFGIVDRELIRPNAYPAGPIVALQILNEGVYSDAQHEVTDYDYSVSSKARFRQFIERKYGSIASYNEAHRTEFADYEEIEPPAAPGNVEKEEDLLAYLDWAEYQSDYMRRLYEEWGAAIRTELPYILNLNPPHDRPEGYDDWFNRLEIEKFAGQNYGYTNWIGVVSHDASAFNRYLLLTKRGRGPNLEENWGFSKLYDYRYRYTAIPFFQTVMAVAGGATGYNIYTAVGTDQWDDGIDTMQEKPYPDCSPIGETGELTPKYRSMKLLNRYFARFGEELLGCESPMPVAWGVYNGYAQLACWGMDERIAKLGRRPAHVGKDGFDRFQAAVRSVNMDYAMLNLADGAPSAERYPVLALAGGFFMAEQVQRDLAAYVRSGGKLALVGDVPALDERMRPCATLREALFGEAPPKDGVYAVGTGAVAYREANLLAAEGSSGAFLELLAELGAKPELESDAQVWVHRDGERDISHFFVLGLKEEAWTYRVRHGDVELEVRLPAKSSAIVRVEGGRLAAGVVKGLHEFEQSYAAPQIRCGDRTVEADAPCDLYFERTDSSEPEWEAVGLNPDDEIRVRSL
ncbi:beta-galactosidase [Cohnella zeiphila]|uniref:Beta-galactosidase n=1 Tax=Cohnella zeiphila TaxID=2761120 RepID=A0A7X0SRQ1_9BACL|nr:beta-galactosidase [Cohnella zeiphila]MBB6734892.1 beta-galactosidase [Cohnella zeiphila]